MLPAYYTLNDEEKDYICSQNDANGMHSCFDLPPTRAHESLICNATAATPLVNGSCVNWNHYYTECKSQGENPFQGTISFDNIGLAWVAIFVVSSPAHLADHCSISRFGSSGSKNDYFLGQIPFKSVRNGYANTIENLFPE